MLLMFIYGDVMKKTILTRTEIADYLKVVTMTIDRYEKKGMPVLRPKGGGDPRYCVEDILSWMEKDSEENK